jgi:high-affinity iron transporter
VGALVRGRADVGAIGLQAFAAVLVVGSYFAAEYLKVRKPRRRGEDPAVRVIEPALLQSQ